MMGDARQIRLGEPSQAIAIPGSDGSCFVKPILCSQSVATRLRITTLHVRVPRIIWPEILTHRVKSRNGRSSRAVPADVMLSEIANDPFIPWHFSRNQRGMQGEVGHDEPVRLAAPTCEGHDEKDLRHHLEGVSNVEAWLWARDRALEAARAFADAGYHKQIFNRIVEPYMYIDGLVTSVGWDNFLWLRDDDATEPHLRDIATVIRDLVRPGGMDVEDLDEGDWHLPYITRDDRLEAASRFSRVSAQLAWLRKISAARCARISYAPFNGDSSYDAELRRYQLLTAEARLHASPMEHQATPDLVFSNGDWARPELHGNLTGFIQARKLDPREFVAG